ncbi:hypothetical protein KDA_76530 [Dictyobacter alpinus]|uniref:Helix-turn-helix domain-containing protein n=1 Tax=Dictyobacter alpinus TaxID=2014873 RepID=A0A402BLG0_9CHLR|nr:hypothetical protein [Dictyobacter alpinus]GCE32169.1 hypothetical protein KDA_76530 [Dictyobacter alpinus]
MPSHDPLALYMTVEETAGELELAPSSIRRMVAEERLSSRSATPDECAALLAMGRIQGVPGTGVRLIHQNAIAQAKLRPKRGRPQQKITKGKMS